MWFNDHVSLHLFQLFKQRVYNCVEDEGREGSPCLTPLCIDTSVLDPAYTVVVVRLSYEFLLDSLTPVGSSRRSMSASIAAWDTVLKALATSSWIATSPFDCLAALIVSFKMWTLMKQPVSCTKTFCLGEKDTTSRSYLSTMPQYVRQMYEPIVRGL